MNRTAQIIAEKTATSVKSNPGDSIYLADLFTGEAKSNTTGYTALSYYLS